MNIIQALHNDQSLFKWLEYSYKKMTDHPKDNIEDIVDHLHRSGYNDKMIYNLATASHNPSSRYVKLMA